MIKRALAAIALLFCFTAAAGPAHAKDETPDFIKKMIPDLSFFSGVSYLPINGGSATVGGGVKYGAFGVDAYLGGPHDPGQKAGYGFDGTLYLSSLLGMPGGLFIELGGYHHSSTNNISTHEHAGWELAGGFGFAGTIPLPKESGLSGIFVTTGYHSHKGMSIGAGLTF